MIDFIYTIGLTLGVGSSTFALIFFIRSLEDGVVDASEKRFMQSVYVVLRIGMMLVFLSLLASILVEKTLSLARAAQVALLFVITLNAFLMTRKLMPMRFGPVLAGGSWYSLFIVSKTSVASLGIPALVASYAFFLVLFYAIFQFLKKEFTIIKGVYGGDVLFDSTTLEQYATDASAFKLTPQAVYFPKSVNDIQALIALCKEKRKTDPRASLTLRAGGTCMSGGPLNTGWIVDMTKHMNNVHIDPKAMTATVEMGAFFRDIEDEAAKYKLMFAAYPSSHRLCGIGGMIGNNASGEKSLRCGATSDNVLELEVVLADGTIRRIAPKDIKAATEVDEQSLTKLHEQYGEDLRKATGEVKKSASGYRLEKVIEGNTFNAVPLFVGAQGTLGIVTKAVLRLSPIPEHTELILISAQSLSNITDIVNTVFVHNPEGLETFDSNTYKKAQKHLPKQAQKILPYIDTKSHLFILAQFSESTEEATRERAEECLSSLKEKGYFAEHVLDTSVVTAAWEIRRNSFLLMRDHNEGGYRAVPCIEDVIVPVSELGTFIEGLRAILKRRSVHYGYHGHIGDGSLRVIPVFDFTSKTVQEDITSLMHDVFALVKELRGNISADHSDGIIRSPYLREFYGEELYKVFEEIKRIYDPENIMNPNKKVGGSIGFLNRCLDC